MGEATRPRSRRWWSARPATPCWCTYPTGMTPSRRRRPDRDDLELPAHLRGSLTWDKQNGRPRSSAMTTGVPVYFCDPEPLAARHNENTNGCSQYFPKHELGWRAEPFRRRSAHALSGTSCIAQGQSTDSRTRHSKGYGPVQGHLLQLSRGGVLRSWNNYPPQDVFNHREACEPHRVQPAASKCGICGCWGW